MNAYRIIEVTPNGDRQVATTTSLALATDIAAQLHWGAKIEQTHIDQLSHR